MILALCPTKQTFSLTSLSTLALTLLVGKLEVLGIAMSCPWRGAEIMGHFDPRFTSRLGPRHAP